MTNEVPTPSKTVPPPSVADPANYHDIFEGARSGYDDGIIFLSEPASGNDE